MKKYEFSLDRIRVYKNSILSREKSVLLGLRMEQRNIEDRLVKLENMFEEINTEMHEKFSDGMTVNQIKLFEYRKNGIREELRALNDRLSFLGASIERQQKRVALLKQEVSGYDKLEDKQRVEYNASVAKEQELVISEFISTKLIREQNQN